MKKFSTGFTLIELLVVVAIIGVLAAVTLSSLSRARDKARKTEAIAALRTLNQAVNIARWETNQTLREITGNTCTACACSNDYLNPSAQCLSEWNDALVAIDDASGGWLGAAVMSMQLDPWGRPYSLDENEGTNTQSGCQADNIRSVGPDGIRMTSDDILWKIEQVTGECIGQGIGGANAGVNFGDI